MQKKFLFAAVGLFLGLLAWVQLDGQTLAPATPAAGTHAPAATVPSSTLTLANVVTDAVAVSGKLREIETGLASDQTTTAVDQSLPPVVAAMDRQEASDKLLESNPTLPALRSAQASWQALEGRLNEAKQTLAGRISQLDAQVAQLGQMMKTWQAGLALAKSSAAPPEILDRIQTVIAKIGETTQAAEALRARILSAQNQVAEEGDRITAAMTRIKTEQENAVNQLFTRDSAPLWNLNEEEAASPHPAGVAHVPFATQWQILEAYIVDKSPTAFIHLLLFILLSVALIWGRRELHARAGDDPAVKYTAQVLEVPLATAAVLALMASVWLYPAAPRLLRAGLGAAALVPAVMILRRLIDRALFPILYAMVLSYLADQVRSVLADTPILSRELFLVEMLAAAAFLVWLLRSQRLFPKEEREDFLERVVRIYACIALLIFGVAAIADILGYTHLSYLLGNAVLGSGYLAVVLYAAVRIADGLIMTALKIRPLSSLGMVRRHEGMLGSRASRVIRWLAVFLWAWETLELFSVRVALWNDSWAVLSWSFTYGKDTLSLNALIRFGLMIWATFLLSRWIRFVLEEEVYPNLRLAPGVSYAASTMVHYVVLALGFLIALPGLGIDLSQYAVLAGALGVGLGFGLQNIMNNFVSGIILLFERPIKVGDVIQVDTSVGTVERIGIRASVIRITNGSEVIMPNGNLISNPVTNWTFSNRQRVIDVPIAVAAKSDPQKVMALLVETAKAHPAVLKEPPPQVLFTNLTGATLNFELRAWTSKNETWTEVRSELFLAISAALARENIAMS